MRRQLLAVLFSLVMAAMQSLPTDAIPKRHAPVYAPKDEWNRQIGWVTVPVFYVTDRHLNVQSGELNYS